MSCERTTVLSALRPWCSADDVAQSVLDALAISAVS